MSEGPRTHRRVRVLLASRPPLVTGPSRVNLKICVEARYESVSVASPTFLYYLFFDGSASEVFDREVLQSHRWQDPAPKFQLSASYLFPSHLSMAIRGDRSIDRDRV